MIAGEAVRFIATQRSKPFFLWVAFSVPHFPLQEEDQWVAPYSSSIKDPSRRLYAASVTHMDAGIGRIIAALEKAGKLSETVIVFTSDNGGQQEYHSEVDYGGKHGPNPVLGDNRPLRGWKTDLYEGGVRVPAFVSLGRPSQAQGASDTSQLPRLVPNVGTSGGCSSLEPVEAGGPQCLVAGVRSGRRTTGADALLEHW